MWHKGVRWHHVESDILKEVLIKSNIFNTWRKLQNGDHFSDGIFNCIFLNENVGIFIRISLKFVAKGSIVYETALF